MKRRILAIVLTGLVSGLIVWAATVALMPRTTMQRAYRRSTSVDRVNERTLQAPVNQIAFAFGLYDADTDIGEVGATAPMADMLYAQGWLDVSQEPMVFDVPDFGDRYFNIAFTDLINLNTGYIGTRATGNQGGRYAVTWRKWEGSLPADVTPVTVSTSQVNFWYRVFVAGPDDLAAADAIRRQVKLYPLSQLGSGSEQ